MCSSNHSLRRRQRASWFDVEAAASWCQGFVKRLSSLWRLDGPSDSDCDRLYDYLQVFKSTESPGFFTDYVEARVGPEEEPLDR